MKKRGERGGRLGEGGRERGVTKEERGVDEKHLLIENLPVAVAASQRQYNHRMCFIFSIICWKKWKADYSFDDTYMYIHLLS